MVGTFVTGCFLAAAPAAAAPLSAFVELETTGFGEKSACEFSTENEGEVGTGVSEITVEGSLADAPNLHPFFCCIDTCVTGFGDENRRFGGSAELRVVDWLPAERAAILDGRWQGIFSRDAATTEIDFTVTELTYGASGYGQFSPGIAMQVYISQMGETADGPQALGLEEEIRHLFFSQTPGSSFIEPTSGVSDFTGDLSASGPNNTYSSGSVTIGPYTRTVDISDIPTETDFMLTIDWNIRADGNTGHGRSYIDFVDPAEFGGGITFDDTGLTNSLFRADFADITSDPTPVVAAVPVPTSSLLLLSALSAMAFGARRRKLRAA